MTTKVYLAHLNGYSADETLARYNKIKEHFIALGECQLSLRQESLIGRILLDDALCQLGVSDYKVEYQKNKKPKLISEKEAYFNISHSDTLVALALSFNEVGCDIQQIKPYNPKVSKRHYCQGEIELIEKSKNKDEIFIRLWALKESVLKLTGEGIAGGMSKYDFSPYANEESFEAFGYHFFLRKIENAYFALCYYGDKVVFINDNRA